jgi:hypothetical protein
MSIQRALPAVLSIVSLTVAAPISPSHAATTSCAELYARHVRDDLAFPYELFDQTENNGFRVLAKAGCDKEAADLIEAYIGANHAGDSSLRWHVAQLKASAGKTAEAIRYAQSVLVEHEDDAKNALRWNDYVLATIAFLEHDMAALKMHRDRVASAGDGFFGNVLNLKLLDSLIEHFDRDYKYASTHIRR